MTPVVQIPKELFIEAVLWETLCITVQHVFHDLDEPTKRDFAGRCLLALEDLHYAVREHDGEGNALFRACPTLLALTGKQSGPLELRGHYRPWTVLSAAK